MAEIICPQCKASNRGTSQYCAECGTPLLQGLSRPAEEPTLVSQPKPAELEGIETRRTGPAEKILQNRYRIEEPLGKGGFGSVYRAWDLNLERLCAIKENLGASADAQRQFMREATVLANLSHPNLPRVIDHFIIPDQGQYLVMDFVDGEDLESILEKREILPVKEALDWILQVVNALDYLHNQQPPIFHRDIKPANIRLTPAGKAMLVDFGLVKVFDPYNYTTEGARAVTPGYAPPEQYGRGKTDARTDIYALGATLYTLTTGHEPVESVRRMAGEHLPTAHQLNPEVSLPLSDAIERAMAMDPGGRFQTAAGFREALQAIREGLGHPQTNAPGLVTVVVDSEAETPAGEATLEEAGPVEAEYLRTQKMEDFPAPIATVAAPLGEGAPLAEPQAAAPAPRRRNVWIIAGAGVALVLLCLGIGGGLGALYFNSSKSGTNGDPVQASLTAHAMIQSTVGSLRNVTATANAQATSLAARNPTATSAQKATAQPTLRPQTESPVNTPTSQQAGETQQAIASYLAGVDDQASLAFGPRSGRILHREEDRTIKTIPASVGLRNFIAETTFVNPYSASEREWDFGMLFRYSSEDTGFLLVFLSDQSWALVSKIGSTNNPIVAQGTLASLKTGAGESNEIRLYAIEDKGYFYFNDAFVDEFDISQHYSGGIMIGIGFYPGTEKTGKLTEYKDFSVWKIPTQP